MQDAAKQLPVLGTVDVEAAYREQAGFVWANLRRFGVGPEQLEDAMHDVFVVVHRRAADFDPSRSSLTTWVFGIVRRVAADAQRGRDRGRRKLDAYRVHTNARAQMRQASRAELRVILADLLSAVDEEAAQIFVSSQLHGVPLHEIAKDMGLNRNTVASRLRVTRRRLRELSGGHSSGPQAAERTVHALRCLDEEDGSAKIPAQTRDRVFAGLLPLWSTPASAAPVSAAPVSPAAGLLLKRLLVAGMLPSLGLAVWLGVSLSSTETEPDSRLAARGEALSAERRQHRPRPGAGLRPKLKNSDTASSPTPMTAALAEPLATGVPASTAPISSSHARPHREASAPVPRTGATTSERPRPPSPPKASAEQVLSSTLQAELNLVTQARSSVRAGRPALALALVREHAVKFESGVLGVEIDLIAVDALCRLGRRGEAETKARALWAGTLDPSELVSVCN